MKVRRYIGQTSVIGLFVVGTLAATTTAEAKFRYAAHSVFHGGYGHRGFGHRYVTGGYGGGLQCVPFARENTGIELAGNAVNWWENAEGIYERGARPEVGSVLNFRANGHMRLGHVAVVSNVIDSRNIEIDHANWSGHGGIGRNVNVVDVSSDNDWSAVRVELGDSSDFGSIYPTYGFIYDRPDHGTMVANNAVAPVPALSAAPRDLRPFNERLDIADNGGGNEEVAEAADDLAPRYSHLSYRHSFRHNVYARGNNGSRYVHFAGRAAHEPFAQPRAGHGAAREALGRTSFIRGPHELAGAHALHGSKRRT